MQKIYTLLLLFIVATAVAQNAADRDPSFNIFDLPLNHYSIPFSGGYTTLDPEPMEVQQDNMILIVESYKKLVRIDQTNQIDHDFTTGSVGQENTQIINNVVVQPDGKILVMGKFSNYGGTPANDLVRLNANGTIDSGFSSGLGLTSDLSDFNGAIVLNDGKILVWGHFLLYNGVACSNLIRLNSNGSRDTTFNTGTATIVTISKVALQSDGKIVVGGDFTTFNGNPANRVIRLNANGSLDAGFTTGTGFNEAVYTLVVQEDDKIVIAGNFTQYNSVTVNRIARLNMDGTFDATFNTGTGFPSFNNAVYHLGLQSDGKVILAGEISSYNGQPFKVLGRLNTDGTKDTTFSTLEFFWRTTYLTEKPHFKILSNGKILVRGSVDAINNTACKGITLLNSDGTTDTGFSNTTREFDGRVDGVVIQPDGKIVTEGSFASYNGIMRKGGICRINTDGSLDTTFDTGTGFGVGQANLVKTMCGQPDGKIIIGGLFPVYNNNNSRRLVRLNTDGTYDNTFPVGNGFNDTVNQVVLQPDGKIVVCGYFTTYKGVACEQLVRLDSNATLDSEFVMPTISNGLELKMFLLTNGKILLGGHADLTVNSVNKPYYALLNANGTLDASYTHSASLGNGNFTMLPDGKMLFVPYEGTKIIKLNADFTIDTSFTSYVFNQITRITVRPDGKILAFDDGTQNILRLLDSNGSLDTSFVSGPFTGVNEGYHPVALLQPDGKILVYRLSTYNGLPEYGITRLLGTHFYKLSGSSKLDGNGNGCDATDSAFPLLKFQTGTGQETIPNATGNYEIGLQEGSYTLTPVLENPSYFTISPSSISVNFPAQPDPVLQNFCVSPNGNHNDLEITLLPIDDARPGFDANYKLIYKNKGTTVLSGSVSLTYNDATLDYVSGNPAANAQSIGTRTWNFVNMAPLQTREINIRLNLNSPMEMPPLNSGDVVGLTVATNIAVTDESPSNNTFVLNQHVVNSYDPNDKTCLEGTLINPSTIGGYVHYMIRFENTGTYPAQNIVVKDYIDPTKFDIASLRTVAGSHPFVTKIQGNYVEFVFEDINLPFDNVTNDGYVVFKIKTKPTLVNGDSFSNTASIYFDFNYPIITNDAVTTFGTLARTDFEFEQYFALYPNPTDDVINIYSKEDIAINTIEIYNVMGQLVLTFPNAEGIEQIDISPLKTGTYFMKLNSEKGTSSIKFIKK